MALRWIVAVCATGLGFDHSNAASLYLGSFVLPPGHAFAWCSSDISIGPAIMSLTVAVLVPAAGMLVDRFGPQRLRLPSSVTFAAALAAVYLLTPCSRRRSGTAMHRGYSRWAGPPDR